MAVLKHEESVNWSSTRLRHEGVTAFKPCLQPAGERSYVRESLSLECKRHTGARCFVWSRAVKDQRLAARQLFSSFFEFLGR